MVKRILLALLALAVFIPQSVKAADSRPNLFRLTRILSGATSEMFRIDFDGGLIPGRNLVSDLGGGSTTNYWRQAFVGALVTSSGLQSDRESWTALSSATNDATRANGISISTANLWNQTSSYVNTDIIQSSVPRNIVMSVSSQSFGGGGGTTTFLGNCTFYGLDSRGVSVSENIVFSTVTTPQASFANPAFISTFVVTATTNPGSALGIGNIAFAVISSFTIQVTSTSAGSMVGNGAAILNIGYGNKIGLANNIAIASDVYKVTEMSGVDTTFNTAMTVFPTLSTVVFANAPNGINRYEAWYRSRRSTP